MDGYKQTFDLLSDALKTAGDRGLIKEDVVPAVVDFAAAIAIMVGGEQGVELAVERLQSRLVDWKDGTFPAPEAAR